MKQIKWLNSWTVGDWIGAAGLTLMAGGALALGVAWVTSCDLVALYNLFLGEDLDLRERAARLGLAALLLGFAIVIGVAITYKPKEQYR